MGSGGFDRVKEIVAAVLELPESDRTRYLDEACAGDPNLRSEVESLLQHESTDRAIFESRAIDRHLEGETGTGADGAPKTIGPFRVLELVGEGGMGVVYRAEQTEPIRRTAAVKVIRRGMNSDEVVARFETERQALAVMTHPNIARVYEAGVTDQGRPYFAMEFVAGEPITDYCDRFRLGIRERLALFETVCRAVHHAHQNGIIHRDLKPTNILVAVRDGKPVPKVIDFGVAKSTTPGLGTGSSHTRIGQVIGTPAYMSPEQALSSGADVDTTTDVYALGVVLYELLCGALPHDAKALRDLGFEELCRVLRDEDPARPSARIEGQDPARARELRGELDWIAMRAIEKDRSRRYPSASEFAADVMRYLSNEPVAARPRDTLYALRKMIRRHRLAFAFAGTVFVLLVAFGAWMSVLYGRARTAEATAAREAETANRVSGFLVDLFRVSDPGRARGNEITARELLDGGIERVRDGLDEEPVVRGRLLATAGDVYSALGLHDEARPLLEDALRAQEGALGADNLEVAETLRRLANLAWKTADYDRSEELHLKSLAILEETLGPDHPDVAVSLEDLANVHRERGDIGKSRELLERALRIHEEAAAPDDAAGVMIWHDLAVLAYDEGDYETALGHYGKAEEIQRRVLGDDAPDLALTLTNRGALRLQAGDEGGARRDLEEGLAIRERALHPDHPDLARTVGNLGLMAMRSGDLEAAKERFERVLRMQEESLGADHPDVAITLHNLGLIELGLGDAPASITHNRRALSIVEARLGEGHWLAGQVIGGVGEALAANGELEEARDHLERALVLREKHAGGDRSSVAMAAHNLASIYRDLGEHERADELYRRARAIWEEQFSADHEYLRENDRQHARLLRLMGRDEEAAELERRAGPDA